MNAQRDFEATYTFQFKDEGEDEDDDLDAPLQMPCCGDLIAVSAGAAQVMGEVRSVDGSQKIDVTPGAVVAADRCPDAKDRTPPSGVADDDFVELYRTACGQDCQDYRVRVYRNGRVEWDGKEGVTVLGSGGAQISAESADALLARFQSPNFWAACPAEPPLPSADPRAEDFVRGDFLTVRIAGHTKSVSVNDSFFVEDKTGVKLAWMVDKVADTHRWRHGDAASEPYTNMYKDLFLPKPGMTSLMRATYRFNPNTAQQTLKPLERLIAKGADVNAADESGWTALMYAAQLDSEEESAVKLLLDGHAAVNRASLHGDTALMMGAYHGVLSRGLLEAGADINARSADGVTALMLLAQHGSPEELKEALAAGAEVMARDLAGHTALDYLLAASCEKPFVALPKPWVQIDWGKPIPCPGTGEGFLESRTLLEAAMKKSVRR